MFTWSFVVPIALASASPNPHKFDGFRHYREGQNPGQRNLHQFATTHKDNMHFRHGKYSCPGRFFAVYTIKILVAHLIVNYDFKFPDGKGRSSNVAAHEYLFPDLEARILIRERPNPLAY